LSYDGSCGDRTYGDRLPNELASRILLDVGRSSQATLNGEVHVTIESLYNSHNISPAGIDNAVMTLHEFEPEHAVTGFLF
jgi:DNA adenine methylase